MPQADLALEEVLLGEAAQGSAALFCFSWKSPALVLGYGQEAASVDLEACRRQGVPVYRRITGGTGVLHHHALSLSLALPASHPWCASIATLYDGFVETLREALAGVGRPVERGSGTAGAVSRRSPICFEEIVSESLLWEGRKVFGGAQARRAGACLAHGTLLFGLDAALQAAVYGVSEGRILAALGHLPPVDASEFQEAVSRAFAEALEMGVEVQPHLPQTSPEVLARYDTPRWSPLN